MSSLLDMDGAFWVLSPVEEFHNCLAVHNCCSKHWYLYTLYMHGITETSCKINILLLEINVKASGARSTPPPPCSLTAGCTA